MTSLRILMVTRGLPFHTLGGMEAVSWDLARAFANAGAEVTILTTACALLPPDSLVEGVRIRCLDVPSGRYSPSWWKESTDAFAREYTETVDVVFSVSAGARAMVRARDGSLPIFVAQAHGTAWGEFISKINQMRPLAWLKSPRNLMAMIEDRAFRSFDAFVAVGEAVRVDLIRRPTRYIIGKMPIYMIENGVEPERFAFDVDKRMQIRALANFPHDAKIILSASRLHQQKGVMEGIEAFLIAAQQEPRLHYAIAGSGPDEERLRARVASSDLSDRIKFLGTVPRQDLNAWLSAADLFLFPTKRVEGLPLNILEARAAGLPVVASKQVIDERFGAIPIDPNDTLGMAQAIIFALDSVPIQRDSLLPEVFSLRYSANQYLDLFSHLVAHCRPSRK